MLNTTIEFDDCEVASVSALAEGLCVRFSAARVLRRVDSAGARPEVGFARGVDLILLGTDTSEVPAGCIGRLAQGRLELDGHWRSQLPLPFSARSAVRLDFSFANRSSLVLRATGVECRYTGPENFAEALFC